MAILLLKGESWWFALCRSPEAGTIMLGRAGAGSLYRGGKAMLFSLAVGTTRAEDGARGKAMAAEVWRGWT
jgi:hypothetical protein